ncbi:MAG: hypothetical protein II453_07595 [Alphaproteobacteria bacterium]|nr:hypothetical protein [Alphaproteobacteria bacterium]
MTNEKLVLSIVPADNLTAYNCTLEVVRRKDEEYKILLDTQPISELGGWHTEPPTEDGCYLVEAITIPYKNSEFLVAEYDTNAQCWYDEAFENPIEIKKWKRI